MSDARRHSVDAPLSKTLVALKRVRSLRDPATNSLSKYGAILEHMNWETYSGNGAILELKKSGEDHLNEEIRNHRSNMELDHSPKVPIPRNTNSRKPSMVKIRGLHPRRNKLVHRVRQDRPPKSVDSTCVRHFENYVEEEVNSYQEPEFESTERRNATVPKNCRDANFMKPSAATSRIGSPYMYASDANTNRSRRSTFGLGTEDTRMKSNDVVGSNFSGCGISYCWSGTPKCRDRNLYSDSEDQELPLLSAEGTEAAYRDAAPYPETPRSLSQKFRPRSFNELVGLNVVAQSLSYALCKGKVAPIYLFHGPRGTGKTSTARIFAAALNCLSLEEQRPCGLCRECMLLFSGRSRNVKEIDATKLDRSDRVKALIKSASHVPYSSHFKIFIIDECQVLREEAWSAILKSIDDLSRHVVYIMITADLDEVPRSSVSRCQKYHFPKIKVADIAYMLQRICIEEGLEFEKDGLYFIAAKSNGSLRDGVTMLDQLGLLGKRITISLAHELIGSVSDDELLELLDLALSSDTSNTVRRARELMGSRVDPLQLVSQMANLIMDILAGRCQYGLSEVSKNFFGRYASQEVGMQKLRHALKILSETEKQLRTSKNQATWLTVALLQFSTGESSPPVDTNDSQEHRRTYVRDDWASRGNLSSTVCYSCNNNKSNCSERHCRRLKLENIWRRAIAKCQSKSFRSFLRKEGCLSSVHVTEDLAIAEVGFSHTDHLTRAEKLQNIIASSLQHVLGCNVEIRLKLVPAPVRKDAKVKRQSFSLLSCSGRKQQLSDSALTDGEEDQMSAKGEPSFRVYSSNHGKQLSPFIQQLDVAHMQEASCFHDIKAITPGNEDTQSTGAVTSDISVLHNTTKRCRLEKDSSRKLGEEDQYVNVQEPEIQPSCFAKTLKLQRKFFSSDATHTICLRIQPHNKMDLSIPKKGAFETYFRTYEPYNQCSRSDSQFTYSSREENVSTKTSGFGSKLFCWRTPKNII
ncbi:protein STICHEL-like 2 [Typha angustifolia]|uniref:protein STICHEL-like 2 n=1 Tax=Typha angustifolia TaxID=59011 RepID=UPI003C2CB844